MANVGDELAVTVANRLNRPTSALATGHRLGNDMGRRLPPEHRCRPRLHLRFSLPHPGTYWGPSAHRPLDGPTTAFISGESSIPEESRALRQPIGSSMLDDWTDDLQNPQQLYDDLYTITH